MCRSPPLVEHILSGSADQLPCVSGRLKKAKVEQEAIRLEAIATSNKILVTPDVFLRFPGQAAHPMEEMEMANLWGKEFTSSATAKPSKCVGYPLSHMLYFSLVA